MAHPTDTSDPVASRSDLEARKGAARRDYEQELANLRQNFALHDEFDWVRPYVRDAELREAEELYPELRADFDPLRDQLESMVGAGPVPDRFGEHDRGARRHFTLPRRDPRSRTAPHGDGLDTRRSYVVNGGRGVVGLDFGGKTTVEEFMLRELAENGVPTFKLHPHQQRFLEMVDRGERVIVIPPRRSPPGWPETFRMAEEFYRAARERSAPWWADAEAAENGMGC